MKKKILAVAIASALVGSPAMAAQDTSGMHFTSASEGFYASLRAEWGSGGKDTAGGSISEAGSRFGVSGSNDLGGGLTGFYTYETGVDYADGDSDLNTRHLHVGLRGGFGQVIVGQFWSNAYNFTTASTDIANNSGGTFSPMGYRVENALEYTTPDLNGFQGVIQVIARDTSEAEVTGIPYNSGTNPVVAAPARPAVPMVPVIVNGDDPRTTAVEATFNNPTVIPAIPAVAAVVAAAGVPGTEGVPYSAAVEDDNEVDVWRIAAKYDVAGFSAGAGYSSAPDGLDSGSEDLTHWVVKLGYAQDNWYVNGWYAEDNRSDASTHTDNSEQFSIAGGVTVDKVNVYAFYEQQENNVGTDSPSNTGTNSFATVGVQYNLGAQTRTYIEYVNRDMDSDSAVDDRVLLGLRHDF